MSCINHLEHPNYPDLNVVNTNTNFFWIYNLHHSRKQALTTSKAMASLAGKIALITGASKGIGAATALTYARLGATVVINYASDEKAAADVLSQLQSINSASAPMAIQADAGSVPEVRSLVEQVVARYGRIDVVVANAGIMPMKDLAHTDEATYDRVMNTNVKGPFFLAQQAAPHMAPGSSIIFVSTTLTVTSTVAPPYLLYLASKGAIEQMVRVMSKELSPKGINVNAVAPGPTASELFLQGKSPAMLDTITKSIPKGRLGEPNDIAEVMAFFAGPQAGWVTGQVLRANGGAA